MTALRLSEIPSLANYARQGVRDAIGKAIEVLYHGEPEVQDISAAGAIVLPKSDKKHVRIAAGGAYAITLAAPERAGQEIIIECISGTSNVDLALTEVQGGSAASQARFNAANETLILKSGTAKWNVVAEAGVTLS
ncbi:MAG: hypothetical protein AAGD08_15960 [Pseudomonadota bacterium]